MASARGAGSRTGGKLHPRPFAALPRPTRAPRASTASLVLPLPPAPVRVSSRVLAAVGQGRRGEFASIHHQALNTPQCVHAKGSRGLSRASPRADRGAADTLVEPRCRPSGASKMPNACASRRAGRGACTRPYGVRAGLAGMAGRGRSPTRARRATDLGATTTAGNTSANAI